MNVTMVAVYQRALRRVTTKHYASDAPWSLRLADDAHGARMVADVCIGEVPVTVCIDLASLPHLHPADTFAQTVCAAVERAAQESLAPYRIRPATLEKKGA